MPTAKMDVPITHAAGWQPLKTGITTIFVRYGAEATADNRPPGGLQPAFGTARCRYPKSDPITGGAVTTIAPP